MQSLNGLPSESYNWDVYIYTKQEIINIKVDYFFNHFFDKTNK